MPDQDCDGERPFFYDISVALEQAREQERLRCGEDTCHRGGAMSGGPERQDPLLEALLNTHDLRHRYHHQAYFRHAVQLLVRALPKHLEFLAQSSDEAERDWVVEEYLTWNPGPVPGDPGREEQR